MTFLSIVLGVVYVGTLICCVVDILQTRRGSSAAAFWLLIVVLVPLGPLGYIFFSEPSLKKPAKPDE